VDVYLPEDTGIEYEDARMRTKACGLNATPTQKIADKAAVMGTGADTATGSANGKKLGVAIDIGTTTVVAHLHDLGTGARLATASGVNAQRSCGADVVSRIRYCAEYGHDTLTRLIRWQIAKLIETACAEAFDGGGLSTYTDESARTGNNMHAETPDDKKAAIHAKDIRYISIAANTIMAHIAAGYDPSPMGTVPFAPTSLFGEEMPAWAGLHVAKDATLYFAPAVSAYFGGDITAGMLAAGLGDGASPAVFIDIGTNGELALKIGDRYLCCATAAGPAFEGAEIAKGMASVSGAIYKVKLYSGADTAKNIGLTLSVIGDAMPRGLCGSGLIDTLAILLDTGAVDETGRLLERENVGHELATRIRKIGGENVFALTADGSVYITASDIRKLQLAKAAIAAGLQTLLNHAGIAAGDVKTFKLAGGFGSAMNPESAARIGLFPECFLPIAEAVGNAAGDGASLALLSAGVRETLRSIRARCEYIELSESVVFSEQFIEHMRF
jgi:uncharacterized 2Fe-2S/4Fe-4S cluster protein (DUF4445 family)